jgi:hypothetical protein
MKPKTLRLSYQIATILFALWLIGDGLGGVLRAQAGVEIIVHLGYPLYILTLTGIAKMLAAVAILQTRFRTIKEWAYAGYAINCLGAAASHFFIGDSFGTVILPFIFLAIMFIPYFLWKKVGK